MRKGNLCAILICLVFMCITVYLIFYGEDYKPKVSPSPEAIERLNKVSDDFLNVVEQTKREISLEKMREMNYSHAAIIRDITDEVLKVRAEREYLIGYVEELEDALTYATEWMDRMMEVLDGR